MRFSGAVRDGGGASNRWTVRQLGVPRFGLFPCGRGTAPEWIRFAGAGQSEQGDFSLCRRADSSPILTHPPDSLTLCARIPESDYLSVMWNFIIYLFPLAFDIIVSVSLFAGRHSLAEQGLDTGTVGSILTLYGIGYLISSLLMSRIVRPGIARGQMVAAVLMTVVTLITLAHSRNLRMIQGVFLILPFTASFFFNAFQSFMLGFDSCAGKRLTRTAAHYTGSWSLGFALGPFIASFVKKNMDWPSAYYVAAGVAAGIGLAALWLRSPEVSPKPRSPDRSPEAASRSLALAAWIGVVVGWTGLNMVFIYWPVQAESLGLDVRAKGLVEFCFALSQSISAFALAGVPSAYYCSRRLPFAGMLGGLALLGFVFSRNLAGFILGSVLYGVYTAHALNAMMFHSMIEKDKAVKRVAINEICIGISFMISAPLAHVVRRMFSSLAESYAGVALLIVAGVLVEWIVLDRSKSRENRHLLCSNRAEP